MQLNAILEKFNLTRKEAAVYLATLEIGGAQIHQIAEKSKMARTTCGDVIRSLQRKGFIHFYKIKSRRIYGAESPEKFRFLLREQEELLQVALPRLKSLNKQAGGRPNIRFYEGADGLRAILKDILNFRHNFLAMTSLEDAINILGKDFLDFIEARKVQYLRVKFLTNRTPKTEEMRKADPQELRQTCFLPGTYSLKTANFIYGDRIAIISLNQKSPTGLIIEDTDIADTQRMYFEMAWQVCGGAKDR